jgi:signal transduction histidine kinase
VRIGAGTSVRVGVSTGWTGCQHGGVYPPSSAYSARVTWPRRLTVVVAVLTAAMVLGTASLFCAAPSPRTALILAVAVILGAAPALAGLSVARKYPDSALGPLLVVPGLVAALGIFGGLAPSVVHTKLPGADYVTAALQGGWVLVYVVVAIPLLFFPDGHLATRSARWLLALILSDATVFMVVAATAPGPFLPPNELSPHVLGTMPASVSAVLTAVSLPGLPITLVALTVHLVRRYRASDRSRRRQFRWLSLGAALLPLTLLGTWSSYAISGNADVVLAVGLTTIYLALPIVIAVAVVRPDLFDVDRVIATTATHAAFTAALLVVFTGANVLAGLVLVRSAPTVAVAAAALFAVILAPARGRVQHRIDQWLYPARKAAYTAIDELHRETVAGRARPEQLQSRLRQALHDQDLVVGYRTPIDEELVDADGTHLGRELIGRRVEISLGTERIGVLSVRAPISAELLRDIAARAAPIVELARLRVDLRRALQEADESRSRLLRVGYEERVRLERDLHDGAQQRLVSLGMALRLAQRRLSRGVDVSGVLDAAVTELGTAVSELRQLAHGIRPSCLDDGLVPALSSLVTSTPIPITLQVTASGLDPDLETTAYYVAAEAITNAVKHADAQHITLNVNASGGELHVRITDDGTGRAAAHDGSGLAGLADRVGAHGGRLAIDSRRGIGTVIEAVLPCASS